MDVRFGLWRKLNTEELMLLNCGVEEDSWESLGLQGDPTSPFWRSQPWDFFGRNDAKAETPVLWPPHVKCWLIGKDPDAGRDWGQEEMGTTEDEMAGWHHWLDGRESEWTPGVGEGQGGLACWDSWGRKESDTTERLIWSDLIWSITHPAPNLAYLFRTLILTHNLLNTSNPTLASDCWICLSISLPGGSALPICTDKCTHINTSLYHTYRGESLFSSYIRYLYSIDQIHNPDKILTSLLTDLTSTHKGPAIGGPTTSDICLQQQAPFCFSRQNSYEQFLPPTRNCTTIPGPRYFWPQICLPHRYLAPDISIPPNNQTLPIPLTHNQPRQAIQFISLLISLGIVAGIGTGTAGLTTSLNYHQSLSKDLTDSLE